MDASMFASLKTSAASSAVRPKLEVISRLPSSPRPAPPILFVHGAWHGAWCWDEFFLDHFAAHGFEAHALSLRAHGASEGRAQLHRCRIRHYVEDVAAVAAALPSVPFWLAIRWAALSSRSSLRLTRLRRRSCSPASRPTGRGRCMRGSCAIGRSTCSGRMRRSVSCRSYRTPIERSGSCSPPRCHGMTSSATIACCRTSRCSAPSTAWRLNGSLVNQVRSPIHVMGAADDAIVADYEIEGDGESLRNGGGGLRRCRPRHDARSELEDRRGQHDQEARRPIRGSSVRAAFRSHR